MAYSKVRLLLFPTIILQQVSIKVMRQASIGNSLANWDSTWFGLCTHASEQCTQQTFSSLGPHLHRLHVYQTYLLTVVIYLYYYN